MNRFVLRSLASAALVAAPVALIGLGSFEAHAAPPAASGATGVINGTVKNSQSGEPLDNALVVLQCNCLQQPIEGYTNTRGIYTFRDLPQGKYTVQVLAGKANISKVTDLPRGAKFRANFSINPETDITRTIVVDAAPVAIDTAGHKLTIDMEQAKKLPMGGDTSRDFTAVVELSPTAQSTAGGISLAGTTGAETKYTVEGASVNSPSTGQVGASLIQEFVEAVEVRESGYEAELGNASGGQVSARRVSGTNTLRGEAGVRFTPRLAAPRVITTTDESLRVQLNGDYQAQAYAIVSGPIKKDKLFFTIGIVPTGSQFTLTQSFYSRVDRDNSGGYQDCPFENGTNDCVDGQNYIATERFAQQKFRTGSFNFGYIAGLDWVVTPDHRIRFTGQGGPGFVRTTYRLPFSLGPNAFGGNLDSDPLSGASRVATGVVNEHFGWDLGQQHTAVIGYQGRLREGKMEIDANVAYSQFETEDAWRLDNPNLKRVTATSETDNEGKNLYGFLDRDGATDLVPGVDQACNGSTLPGIACPTRQWLSGGIGEFDRDLTRRVEGNLALTHFFNGAGSHQLKYGGGVEWLQRRSTFQYSGSNEPDFYDPKDECQGEESGGEYCYDRANNDYFFQTSTRVNNNRFIVVDTDRPDDRQSIGFGTVRHEQNDLRALADPLGRGVRAQRYDETLSTYNYNFFLQDRWAILSNLSISAGVRWEVQDMRDIFGDSAVLIWDNVAPRLGVVYDWTDEGKSRLYASYGWFYQPLPLALNSRVFGGLVNVFRTYNQSDCAGQVTNVNGESKARIVDGQPTEYCTDNAQFTTGLTGGAIVPRLRGQYNQQFQVGYEQEIIEDLVVGFRWLHTDLGRAVEDVSTNGGTNFIIANPGVAVDQDDISEKQAECDSLSSRYDEAVAMGLDSASALARERTQCEFLVDAYDKINNVFDKPTRNFDAWSLELRKRFAKNWLFVGSYTYSRLVGNYDGFVDPVTGAVNLGASTQYDLPELVRNSFGPLSQNIPHRINLSGFYTFDLKAAGRLTLGTNFRFQSGLPVNVKADSNRYPNQFLVYVLPRGSGGRVQPNYRWNLSLGYAYPLPKDLEIEFNARVINVTNAKAVLRVDEVYSFQDTRPVAGGDLGDLKHAKVQPAGSPNDFFNRQILAPQGNFGVETQFQQPLSAQFELKLRF